MTAGTKFDEDEALPKSRTTQEWSMARAGKFALRLIAPRRATVLALTATLVLLDTAVRSSLAWGGWGLRSSGLSGLGLAAAAGMLAMALRTQLARVADSVASKAFHRAATRELARSSALDSGFRRGMRFERQYGLTAWRFRTLWATQVPSLVGGAVTTAVAVWWLAPRLDGKTWLTAAVAVGILTPYVFWLHRWVRRLQRQASKEFQEGNAELGLLMRDQEPLAAAAGVDPQAERVVDAYDRAEKFRLRVQWLQSLTGRVPLLLAASAAAFVVGWKAPPGLLNMDRMGMVLVAGSLVPALLAVFRGLPELTATMTDVGLLGEMLGGRKDPHSEQEPSPIPWNETVRFHQVSYWYEGGQAAAVQGLSFRWNPEELLCLTGPNGGGKSTALRLLLRLDDPQEGAIYVGSTDLRALDVEQWRKGLAYLPQNLYLPEKMTVREVADRLYPAADTERLMQALQAFGLLDRLKRVVQGDPLAATARQLSAGQQRRLALALVMASDARMVLLDEPDASLDAEGFERLIGILPEWKRRARILMVAHRPDLIARADRAITIGSKIVTKIEKSLSKSFEDFGGANA